MATPAPPANTPAETPPPAAAAGAPVPSEPAVAGAVQLPRIVIQFCTQCKWMLRAAYFAQELLSTFSTALGEVALQPATGGVFRVTIESATTAAAPLLLWDRKTHGGFPETKELKRRVRDVVAPGRDLGHVDRTAAVPAPSAPAPAPASAPVPTPAPAPEGRASTALDKSTGGEAVCEDCQ